MIENKTRYHNKLNDIEFRMIRKDEKCWIKIVPLIRESIPSSLHLILNNEFYSWDIYDKNGRESHEIFFEGVNTIPSFYLKSDENCYRIDCKYDSIKVIKIRNNHKQDIYIKENCNCLSPQASCWAKDIYFTSRPDKSPFDEM
jgi:hypothetical protein